LDLLFGLISGARKRSLGAAGLITLHVYHPFDTEQQLNPSSFIIEDY
jgi:hypothetical protein